MSKNNIIIGVVIVLFLFVGGFFLFNGQSDTTAGDTQVNNTTVGDTQENDIAAVGGNTQTNNTASNEDTQVKYDKAPPFSLEDYDGNTVTLNDFPGKVLIVNSWATWCPFCVNELPDFEKLQQEFPDDIVVIAIDRSESLEQAQSYTTSLGLEEDILFLLDPKDDFYQSIGGFSMPETLFVDADGNIRTHKRGPMRIEEMRDKVNNIL